MVWGDRDIGKSTYALKIAYQIFYDEKYNEGVLKNTEIGKSVPFIVTSGIGNRVVYYALPLEYFANPRLADFERGRYFQPIENMYYGLLTG